MNTVASLPDRLRWMLDDCRNLGINEQTVNLDVIEQAAAALATPEQPGSAVRGEVVDLERFRPAVAFWRGLAEFAVDVESIGHFTFKQPVEAYQARVTEADSLLRLIDGCDCPGVGKTDPRLHAPNCPVRTTPPPDCARCHNATDSHEEECPLSNWSASRTTPPPEPAADPFVDGNGVIRSGILPDAPAAEQGKCDGFGACNDMECIVHHPEQPEGKGDEGSWGARILELSKQAGYDDTLPHPCCFHSFSYLAFAKLLAAAPGAAVGVEAVNTDDTDGGIDGYWYCERHPWALQGHDGCESAGLPGCARIDMLCHIIRMRDQELRERDQQYGFLAEQFLAQQLVAVAPVGVDEEMVERAMRARIPGGAEAWVWLFNCEGGMAPEDKHRDWFRNILTAALAGKDGA